jgi:ribose/xylose/arabinose/galactoside ABC-type transport system permease subunit
VVPLLLFVSLVVCAGIVFQKTVFGRHLYAVGGNRDASRLAGIHTDGVTVGAYVLSSLFAALGGLYMTARISCGDPSFGAPFQMDSITAAVIGGAALTGGRGNAVGTMFGVILVVMLGNIFNLVDIDIYWQQVIRGLILLGVVGFSQFSMRRRDQLKQKKIAA